MQNMINWFEIPVSDFARAKAFYEQILAISIQDLEMEGNTMGMFPGNEQVVSGAIVKSDNHFPSDKGCVVYLNGGSDLNVVLGRVEQAGGNVVVPKTMISPEMGYFAFFADTEGNTIGLHSIS